MVRVCSIVLLGTTILSTPAWAQSPTQGFYVGGALGQSIVWDVNNIDFDFFGWMIAGIGGYRLNQNLRVEGELLYETADLDNSSSDIEVFRVLTSGFYDFPAFDMIGRSWRPYAGAGAGFANVDFVGNDNLEFTVHGEGGVGVEIIDGLEIVPGIRQSYTTLDGGGDDLWVTEIRAGVRYSF